MIESTLIRCHVITRRRGQCGENKSGRPFKLDILPVLGIVDLEFTQISTNT